MLGCTVTRDGKIPLTLQQKLLAALNICDTHRGRIVGLIVCVMS